MPKPLPRPAASPRQRPRLPRLALLAGALAVLVAGPASAQDWRFHHDDGRHDGWRGHEAWRGDIHRFREHDFERWRAGRWFHGRHDGRRGWWWIVGGVWYFYPAPVYPYPDPYQPPVVVAPGPPVSGPPVAQPPAVYYYCDNPAGYYPYVPQCLTPWRMVPAG
jgi:hypothetical protein